MGLLLSRRNLLRSLVAAGLATITTRIAVVRPECWPGNPLGGGLARVLPPSRFPLSYEDIIHFHGDWAAQGHPDEVVNPKGIVYSPALDRVIVSLSPYTYGAGQMVCTLTAVARDGRRRDAYAPGYRMSRDVEPQLAIVPAAGPPARAGFTPGDLFVGRGPGDVISRLSSSGRVLQDPFVDLGPEERLPGVDSTGPWGGLAFDTEGEFDGSLIVAEANGRIYRVGARGAFHVITDLKQRLEGVAVAPAHFGPVARHIIVGVEGTGNNDPASGRIYAIDASGKVTLLANIGFAAESIQFVPLNGGTYYQTELRFDGQAENRVLLASASQFLSRRGRMIVVNEYWGDVWEVDWNGKEYTQSLIGRPPRPWTTTSMCDQSTELEAGCFAERPPALPAWNDWVSIPGTAATDRAPAAGFDAVGDLHVFVTGKGDHRIYVNSVAAPPPALAASGSGWRELPGGVTTPHALSVVRYGQDLFALAVRVDGAVVHRRLRLASQLTRCNHCDDAPCTTACPATAMYRPSDGIVDFDNSICIGCRACIAACSSDANPLSRVSLKSMAGEAWTNEPWAEVPGGRYTDTAVSAAAVNGKLVLAAKSIGDGHVYMNEMTSQKQWTGWRVVPGGGRTDAAPTVTGFQDELYVLIRELRSKQILAAVRLRNGAWSEWAELPGQRVAGAPVAALATGTRAASGRDEQLYVFATGAYDRAPYWNVASGTGTWSGWQAIPPGGATDVALAGAVFDDRPSGAALYLLANGIEDGQILLRQASLKG